MAVLPLLTGQHLTLAMPGNSIIATNNLLYRIRAVSVSDGAPQKEKTLCGWQSK